MAIGDERVPADEEEGVWCVTGGRRTEATDPHRPVPASTDEHGKLRGGEPERVDGQYNIYDSVPGMEKYSPLWQFNYVVVPRDYEPNRLRSEHDCLQSGYRIEKSTIVEN